MTEAPAEAVERLDVRLARLAADVRIMVGFDAKLDALSIELSEAHHEGVPRRAAVERARAAATMTSMSMAHWMEWHSACDTLADAIPVVEAGGEVRVERSRTRRAAVEELRDVPPERNGAEPAYGEIEDGREWSFRPVRELDSTNDRHLFMNDDGEAALAARPWSFRLVTELHSTNDRHLFLNDDGAAAARGEHHA